MRNAEYEIQKAYYALLNNAVTINSVAIPVYDALAIPINASYPFIELNAFYATSLDTKDSFGATIKAQIRIFTKFIGEGGSKKQANDIATQIYNLLRPSAGICGLNLDNFSVSGTQLSGQMDRVDDYDAQKVYSKILTFTHLITEK